MISEFEGAIAYLNDDSELKTEMRNEFVNIITNHKQKSNARESLTMKDRKMLNNIKLTKTFLNDNPDLVIIRADKGNVTVVMHHNDYIEKMESMLSDRNTYLPISKIAITTIKRELNSMISEWESQNRTDSRLATSLRDYDGVVAKMYGLPKIHKLDIPLRPICSTMNTPLYNLSSFLTEILNGVIGKSASHITNSLQFKNKISHLTLPDDHILISLDVVSLFTNINIELILRIIDEKWWEIKRKSKTKLLLKHFKEALTLVLTKSEFIFNHKYYKQIFGVAMGSPVSMACANLVMEDIESRALKALSYKPLIYCRFVDDTILAIPRDQIQNTINIFNSIDSNIKFTMEIESDKKLPFLDTLIIRSSNGLLRTDWFRKKTWSGRYLNFDSWLPMSYKMNTISLLTQKILSLSDEEFHEKNFKLLQSTLTNNGYPKKIIKKVMENTKQKFITNVQTENHRKRERFITLPYIKGLFENVSSFTKKFDFKTVGRSYKSLGSNIFSEIKNKTPKEYCKNIIYKCVCSNCNMCYIGQTKNQLQRRISKHISDVKHTNNDLNMSALTRHMKSTGHMISIDDVSILDYEKNYKKREILEMIHIKKTQNTMNKQNDTLTLPAQYNTIIKNSRF